MAGTVLARRGARFRGSPTGGSQPRGSGSHSPRSERRHAGFALFTECLLTGVWLALAALPLVTALPATAAACAHLRRHLAHEEGGLREFLADCRRALRTGWRFVLAWCAGMAVLALDVWLAASGLPGGAVYLPLGALGGVALLVLGLRTAAHWRPEADWTALARSAARRCRSDLSGSLLLAGGLLVVAVSCWQLPPLGVLALGCLALAAVAVERRYQERG